MIDAYVRALERSLRLRPEEIRVVLAEVRGSLEDHAAYLEAGGMDRAAAEEQAIARFGTARGMARALHRAHGRFPLPMRAVIWTVGVVGVGWTVLLALTAPALVRLVLRSGAGYYPAPTQHLALFLLAALIVLASLSLGAAALGVHGERRGWRGLNVRLWIWLVAVLNCLPLLFLWSTVRNAGDVTESRPVIPYLSQLAAAGFMHRPAASQPADPVQVDYVITDSTLTYVAYSIPNVFRTGAYLYVRLYDDQGREYSALSNDGWLSGYGYRELLPWRQGGGGLALFPGLRVGTRIVTVRFSASNGVGPYLGPNGIPASAVDLGEAVHVRLDARTAAIARIAQPSVQTTVQGVSVAVVTVATTAATTHIVYTITSPANVSAIAFGDYRETDDHGRTVPSSTAYNYLLEVNGTALNNYQVAKRVGANLQYTWDEVFAPRPRGSRLVLTVDGMCVTSRPECLSGRWRLAVTMP